MAVSKKHHVTTRWLVHWQACGNVISIYTYWIRGVYLHWIKIHAHILSDNVSLAAQKWQRGARCLISWRTSAQPVYIDPIQDQEVNLIIKLHKRANFLFNHFCNEQWELWASWKPILWVLSGASCVLISLFFLVEHGSWDPALTSFSVMQDLPFSVIVSQDCVCFEQ